MTVIIISKMKVIYRVTVFKSTANVKMFNPKFDVLFLNM